MENGQIVTLDNNKEYVVTNSFKINNNEYVTLMSIEKPIDIEILKELITNNEVSLIPITDEELELIKKYFNWNN